MYGVRVLRGSAGIAAVALLGMVVVASGTRLQTTASAGVSSDAVYLPDARLLRPLVIGYDNVLGNLLWFRTISYFTGNDGGFTRSDDGGAQWTLLWEHQNYSFDPWGIL